MGSLAKQRLKREVNEFAARGTWRQLDVEVDGGSPKVNELFPTFVRWVCSFAFAARKPTKPPLQRLGEIDPLSGFFLSTPTPLLITTIIVITQTTSGKFTHLQRRPTHIEEVQ